MIPVSAAYKTAANADVRRFVPRVLVYFDGDAAPPVEFGEDQITFLDLVEEGNTESDNPLGAVSANELTVGFDNSARSFTPTNELSPYFGKLKKNTLVQAYLGLETEVGVEWVPLGNFRTKDWSAPAANVEATVTCCDRLYELGNKDIPLIPVEKDTTVSALFEALFQALGLQQSEYIIDPKIYQPVSIGWVPKGKVKEAMQRLAIAGLCNVMVDRLNRVRVVSVFAKGDPVAILTDTDQIIEMDSPQEGRLIYGGVKVNYKYPYLADSAEVANITGLTINVGQTTLRNLEFSVGPVGIVESIELRGAVTSRVSGFEIGAWSINLIIENAGPTAEIIDVVIRGRPIECTSSVFEVQDEAVQTQGEDFNLLVVDNELIQASESAQSFAHALLWHVRDPVALLKGRIRGDPALEVFDLIRLKDPADRIEDVTMMITRQHLIYDGSLEAEIEVRKPVVPKQWVFISPGLPALVELRI
ncbi:MAG: hypothetical protein H5U02_00565 [Clostridia bacterium]|nr:hypothetical protein [Clostridia bacterium]